MTELKHRSLYKKEDLESLSLDELKFLFKRDIGYGRVPTTKSDLVKRLDKANNRGNAFLNYGK